MRAIGLGDLGANDAQASRASDGHDAGMTTIVMTGGTSGIGRIAAERMRDAAEARVLLGARRPGPDGVETLPLDLTQLDEVRRFAAEVRDRLEGPVDALVLNAGVSAPHVDVRTPNGFERTFAVNHLAHHLLARLLLDSLGRAARVVITSSGTHDPARSTRIPPPHHADAARLARPESDPDRDADPTVAGGRAYAASKLCNVLTVRAIAARPVARERGIRAIAYDPGPTPGTGLARHRGPGLRALWALLGSPLGALLPGTSTVAAAGAALASLALGASPAPPGRVYALLRRGELEWIEPSELARRDDVMEALWRDSEALVGSGP